MKELSIEEKAKRYDEILARAEGAYLPYYNDAIMSKVKEFVDYLIPELAESEDERIKNEMITYLSTVEDKELIPYESWMAWLERQGKKDILEDAVVDSNEDGLIADTIKQGKKKHIEQKSVNNKFKMTKSKKQIILLTQQEGNNEIAFATDSLTHAKNMLVLGLAYINELINEDDKESVIPNGNFLSNYFPLEPWSDEQTKRNLINFLKSLGATEMPQASLNRYLTYLEKQGEQKPTKPIDLRTWKYIVDAVLTEREGIGQYIDSPWTTEVAEKLQKRFGNIEQKPAEEYNITGISSKNAQGKLGEMIKKKLEMEKQNEQKTANKVEPKFKVGDWVVYCGKTCKITGLHYGVFTITNQDGSYFFNEVESTTEPVWHLWTIQDAKDGDVLSYRDGQWIFIYKKQVDDNSFHYYSLYSTIHQDLTIDDSAFTLLIDGIVPATKEQCDLLFQKMKEAGYEFDFEKRELMKIENEIEIPFGAKDSELQEATYYIPKGFHAEIEDDKVIIKKGEQKPAWSEEDDIMVNDIDYALRCQITYPISRLQYMSAWILNLKDRVQPQSRQEWSEEDRVRIANCIQLIGKTGDGEVEWLKSLKSRILPQPKQEWSEDLVKEALLSEVLPLFMHGGEADEVVAKLDEVMSAKVVSQPKPAWSEEDELQMQGIIDLLPGLTIRHNWLKSLKDRVQPKQEWSEEDERMLKHSIHYLDFAENSSHTNNEIIEQCISWLKSLKDRYTWKPSDEQMKAVEEALSLAKNCGEEYSFDLRKLLEQLKAL